MRSDKNNPNRLSWWFPQLPSDIPVPKTEIINCDGESLLSCLDGKKPPGLGPLCHQIMDAGNRLEWPIFLRTDYLSGKHHWKDTCFIENPTDVPKHVIKLIEESCMADLWGFPIDSWVVREIIPTKTIFTAFYGDMPITKERRYFVQDNQVLCHHPYWPSEAFENRPVCAVNWKELLYEMNVETNCEIDLLSKLSVKIGSTIGGSWSIDWLWSELKQQWFMIDMAEANVSYHWPECFNAKEY